MLRVTSVWTGKPGSPWYSNLYFQGSLSTEAQDAVDAVRALMTRVNEEQIAGIECQIEEFVASINPATGDVTGGFGTSPGGPLTSAGNFSMLPAAAQLLVQFRTAVYNGGREVRGKMYLPGYGYDNSDGDGRLVQSIANSTALYVEEALTQGPQHQVWSRKAGQALDVTAYSVSREFAMLRSRRD